MTEKCDELPKEVRRLLKQSKSLSYSKEKGKICCELSGHEMPCKVHIIQSYLSGKKFAKLQRLQCVENEELKKHLVQSHKKGREHQLFCLLTQRHLNNRYDHIQKHIEGKRFQRALKRWEECQRTGEVYKPAGAKRKRQFSLDSFDNAGDKKEEEDENDSDNMSDLYPDKDFDETQEEEDDSEDKDSAYEFDMEDEESDRKKSTESNIEQNGSANSGSVKRKKKQHKSKKKTKKKQ